MATEPVVYNDTIPYIFQMLENIKTEIKASQSAMLAHGFLEFDAQRIASELESVKSTILNEKPIDLPETHPHPAE
ncbi:MAG TPA: hypothetical protein VMX96_09430 [Dehalococcoidia bacterium]|nr:hypothetical protein [Dehalococcoidia bacterium]